MSAGKAKRLAGFTLIELLVALAVAIILATIAVPNFQTLITTSRLTADYNKILTAFHYARSEAVKRRETIRLEVEDDDGAWLLLVTNEGGETLRQLKGSDERVSVSYGSVGFNSLGRRVECEMEDGCKLQISHAGSSRAITVEATGRIKGNG